jgi:HlyD family secretion protein
MSKYKKFLLIICVLVIIVPVLIGYLSREDILVKTSKAVLQDITQSVTYSGSIEAPRRVRVSTEIASRVVGVFFEELDEVREGQVLVKLDDVALKAQLNRALEALNQADINLINAQENLNRVAKLFERGFASEEQLDSAKQAFDVSQALVKQNQSNYEMVRARVGYTTIRAPLSGTIINKNVNVGEIVAGPLGGGGNLTMPTSIAEIADLTNLEVHVNVDEIDIGKIAVGQKALISVEAFPQRTIEGKVEEIALSTISRREMGITYRVKVRIGTPGKSLKLGMTATVDFLIRTKQQVLTLPKNAIIAQGDKKLVYILSDQRVYARELVTGIEGEEIVEVTSGLHQGEEVVVGISVGIDDGEEEVFQDMVQEDILKLKDGQEVKVIP